MQHSVLWALQHPIGGHSPHLCHRALHLVYQGCWAILTTWQHDASSFVERHFDSSVWPLLGGNERAMLRSQGVPLSGLPFMALPVTPLSRFDSDLFRVLLLRRLRLPLPLSSRSCRCGRPLDCLGHHRAARVCREAGARVSTNVFLRDLDVMAVPALDARRIIEVIAEGIPTFHGAQLAIDTTLVSPLRADGEPHRRCSDVDGAASEATRRRQERTYPVLSGDQGRAKLTVLERQMADSPRRRRHSSVC